MIAASLLIMVIAGCGGDSGPPRYDVSGTVTYNGQPVPEGVISFRPDGSKGNEGPAANANIIDGKYDTSVAGKGTVGGAHVVIIRGFDGEARPDDELPHGKPLFSEYTTNVDLPKSQGETIDFDVQP